MNLPTDYLEGGKLLAVLTERQEFTDVLKRMLAVDQGRRIILEAALNHAIMTKDGATGFADTIQVEVHTTRLPLSQRFSLQPPERLLRIAPHYYDVSTFPPCEAKGKT
jgi:hypothetical protein